MLYLNIVLELLLWVKCNIFGKGSEWYHFFYFFIFCYKNRGCHASCSSCPSPYDHAGDIHMFYWTRFLYRQSYYWKIGFFKCPTRLSPLLWMKWEWDKNEYQQWFFQQFTRKKNQIKIEDDKASAISQPFRTIPLWARICASWCNCVPCFLPSFSIILRLKSGSN